MGRANPPPEDDDARSVRLDKWMWAARFFKTRSLAAECIGKGRVMVNGQVAKASREPRVGDVVEWRDGISTRSVTVRAVATTRGSATVAAALFEESAASLERRQAAIEWRRLSPEPAQSQSQGRPTKRDRRQLQRAADSGQARRDDAGGDPWRGRWSASLGD